MGLPASRREEHRAPHAHRGNHSRDSRGKAVAVNFDLNASEHLVLGDAARLHQVFWNILKNAIEFTPAGGQITVRATNPGRSRIRVEVADNGVGIEPTFLTSVFGAFVQGDRKASGAWQGATFTVELETDSSVVASAPAVHPGIATSTRYRLLVVEDHPPTLDVLMRLLRT